jgi:hypothetical protein
VPRSAGCSTPTPRPNCSSACSTTTTCSTAGGWRCSTSPWPAACAAASTTCWSTRCRT